eukprot:EG_transcript_29002
MRLQSRFRSKFPPSTAHRPPAPAGTLQSVDLDSASEIFSATEEQWTRRLDALHLPSEISESRRQFGSPPRLVQRRLRAEYEFTAEEREALEEPRSFHRGPLSPGSVAFRSRIFTDRTHATQQKALRRAHRANEYLEGVVSECYTMSANANLDAFANALESHLRRSTNAGSKLRGKAKYPAGHHNRIWRAPGSPSRLLGSREGSSFMDASMSVSQ